MRNTHIAMNDLLNGELLDELSDGDPHLERELTDGREYLTVTSALRALERSGVVDTWLDSFNYPDAPQRMWRLTETALKIVRTRQTRVIH